MYIGSTNLYLDLMKSNNKVPANWIASEKYENCEGFNQDMAERHSRLKFFHKKNKNAY